jgi:hypothetical protein
MSFEFGVFHEFPRCAGQTDAEVFTQSFAQVDAAERWGLDVIWIAELHFLPERSVASAPLLIASAIARQTRRINLALLSRCCHCVTHYDWPRRSQRSITSVMGALS